MRIAALALTATLVGLPALADRIDGDWCSPDGAQSVFIDGPRVVTPGGSEIVGEYSRHAFAFTVPDGEPGAGRRIEMRQLSDEAARVYLHDRVETWRRCQLTS